MEEPRQPSQRTGLGITSDLFIFEDPERIRKTLNGLFGAFLVASVAIFILALIVDWVQTIWLAGISTIAFAKTAQGRGT